MRRNRLVLAPLRNHKIALGCLSALRRIILIDEYDASVVHRLDDLDKAELVRMTLSDVYLQMKNLTGDIPFFFMTGVSKFTKPSVFSAVNGTTSSKVSSPSTPAWS